MEMLFGNGTAIVGMGVRSRFRVINRQFFQGTQG